MSEPSLTDIPNNSPWPVFRRDRRNSGRSPHRAEYNGDQPWTFQTAKGIFSTPVIDVEGTIYVGSGDHFFYAIGRDGLLRWKFQTGEIIDSAAALSHDSGRGEDFITLISGDGFMYQLRVGENIQLEDRLVWKFEAELRTEVSYNRWFEGNVAIGADGTIYAGNTNFNYYAVTSDGRFKWTFSTGSNNWSQAAFGEDGTIFWGSLDTFIRAVSPAGRELWRRRTLGFIAASAAVGSDGTVYIGSFDSRFYALDPVSGRVKWKFPCLDHIYSSAGLGEDQEGNTNRIYFGSTDGSLYALDPTGKMVWKYDTGAPIRSSPAVGLSPDGLEIVYFGCGNGRLYALNGAEGTLRWTYDTTPDDPELRDRNDLNGSPALGETGVYIGGEHGFLQYVPYDYPLYHPEDPHCLGRAGELPAEFCGLKFVSPGGNISEEFPSSFKSADPITLRLIVREGNETIPARLYNNPIGQPKDALLVKIHPDAAFEVEHSADGRYIHIRPTDFLMPGGEYELEVSGRYYSGGLRIGNLTLGGQFRGRFRERFRFRTAALDLHQLPVLVSSQETSAIIVTRLAAPLPTMLPSLNQLGFDYIFWLVGLVDQTLPDEDLYGRALFWTIGAKINKSGEVIVDPGSDFAFPLAGSYQGNDFILANHSFNMAITGIPIPFNLLEMRGRLGEDLIVEPGGAVFADAHIRAIPNFGFYMMLAGLANNWWERLLVSGTYITKPYPDEGSANKRPFGIAVHRLEYHPPSRDAAGILQAFFHLDANSTYPLEGHHAGLLLVDAATLEPVKLDYQRLTTSRGDSAGDLRSVSLSIPKGIQLPEKLQAYVLLDVFPIFKQRV